MRRLIVGVVLAMAAAGSAWAFGTVNSHILGQHAEHEHITRLALSCAYKTSGGCFETKTMDVFAGTKNHFGDVGRPDDPTAGMLSLGKAHCDNGDYVGQIKDYPQSESSARNHLNECKAWMQNKFDIAIADAALLLDGNGRPVGSQIDISNCATYAEHKGNAKCLVLEDLGVMMHAAQDFYSHSNWVDKPKSDKVAQDNPPGLNRRGPADWISMDPAKNNAEFPKGLMTGCYNGYPEWSHCVGHTRHDYLNKDEGSIDMKTRAIGAGSTSRGKVNNNFRHAVEAAIGDSQTKWNEFVKALKARYGDEKGKRMACLVAKDSSASCK